MNVAVANGRSQDIQGQAHDIVRRQVQEWFNWMDAILDVHRANFVFREATSAELEQHKAALRWSILTCNLFNAWVANADFNEPDLTRRLQIRIRQLQDAYNTFHDPTLSDEQAEKILKQVFPE